MRRITRQRTNGGKQELTARFRRRLVAAIVGLVAIVAVVLPTQSRATAFAEGPSVIPAGTPLRYYDDNPEPRQWRYTMGEDVLTDSNGVTQPCVVLPETTRGEAIIVETAPGRHELWSDAGLGQDTVVQLTMWRVHYSIEYKYDVPWTSSGVQYMQGRGRVVSSEAQPTDAQAAVEVQYSESRHIVGDMSVADQVKWAIRVNLDGTVDVWIYDPDLSNPKQGIWSSVNLDVPIAPAGMREGVPVTVRFGVDGDTDSYVGSAEILVGSEMHLASGIAGLSAGKATVPRIPRLQDGTPIQGVDVPEGAVDPSITFSLENSSSAAGGACRPRSKNERAVTRYELDYSGILGSQDAQNLCSSLNLPCLPAGTGMAPTCMGRPVSVDIAMGDRPTEADDTILGGESSDTINALDGDDVVCAGGGNDRIDGGGGSDTIFGDAGADTIHGGDGNDSIWGGTDNDIINGGAGVDRIRGEEGDDEIDGGDDRDVILGGGGDDDIMGGTGRDSLYGGPGNDTVDGGPDTDLVRGEAGHDELFSGESGNDRLVGGSGNDTLDASMTTGSTRMRGEDGDDIFIGSPQLDRMWGDAGIDTMNAGAWGDLLRGGDDNDIIYGEVGPDIIDGGDGDDMLFGGHGNDRLVGFTGAADECNGGHGTGDVANRTCEIVINVP